MRKLFLLIALALSLPVLASDFYLQSVASTSPTSAASTVLVPSMQYSVQCDVAARYRSCALSTCTAVANDMLLEATKIYDIALGSDDKYLAFLSSSGVATCRIYRVLPRTLPE